MVSQRNKANGVQQFPEGMIEACTQMVKKLRAELDGIQEDLEKEAERAEATGEPTESVQSHQLKYIAAICEGKYGCV